MKYLFNTNIIIGFFNKDKNIIDRIKYVENINLSVITVGELLYGANNSVKKKGNLELYNNLFEYCRLIEIDKETSMHYSNIRYELKKFGKPIPENDIWIAATAMKNKMIIITRDKHLLDLKLITSEEW